MTARRSDIAYYAELFATIKPLERWRPQINHEVARVLRGKSRYMSVQQVTGVPWVFPACVHELECDCNFARQILNGELIGVETKLVPKGHGPWKTWEESAIEALRTRRHDEPTWKPLDEITDWTTPNLLYQWELWNGMGYSDYHNANSPYLWHGSNHGVGCGYYGSDGHWSATLESQQIGAAVLLREIQLRGEWSNPMDDA